MQLILHNTSSCQNLSLKLFLTLYHRDLLQAAGTVSLGVPEGLVLHVTQTFEEVEAFQFYDLFG